MELAAAVLEAHLVRSLRSFADRTLQPISGVSKPNSDPVALPHQAAVFRKGEAVAVVQFRRHERCCVGIRHNQIAHGIYGIATFCPVAAQSAADKSANRLRRSLLGVFQRPAEGIQRRHERQDRPVLLRFDSGDLIDSAINDQPVAGIAAANAGTDYRDRRRLLVKAVNRQSAGDNRCFPDCPVGSETFYKGFHGHTLLK